MKLTNLNKEIFNVIDDVLPKDVAALKTAKDPRLLRNPELTGLTLFGLNTTKSPFNNKALRQAVSYAVDYEAIWKNIFYGTDVVRATALYGSPLGLRIPRASGTPTARRRRKPEIEGGRRAGGVHVQDKHQDICKSTSSPARRFGPDFGAVGSRDGDCPARRHAPSRNHIGARTTRPIMDCGLAMANRIPTFTASSIPKARPVRPPQGDGTAGAGKGLLKAGRIERRFYAEAFQHHHRRRTSGLSLLLSRL